MVIDDDLDRPHDGSEGVRTSWARVAMSAGRHRPSALTQS